MGRPFLPPEKKRVQRFVSLLPEAWAKVDGSNKKAAYFIEDCIMQSDIDVMAENRRLREIIKALTK